MNKYELPVEYETRIFEEDIEQRSDTYMKAKKSSMKNVYELESFLSTYAVEIFLEGR